MATPRGLPLLAIFLTLVYWSEEFQPSCGSDNGIYCKTRNSCIYLSQVCDSSENCSDKSDEESSLCEFWSRQTSKGSIKRKCNNPGSYGYIDKRICKMINDNRLSYEAPLPQPAGMNLSSEVVGALASAVNSTVAKKGRSCPMLYTPVGDQCFSFFSSAKLPWPEARQFCQSIYGDLAFFSNITLYSALLEYIMDAGLTTSYWLGGRYDMDFNAWSWVHDDSYMPLGSPYWAVKYKTSCVPRLPHSQDAQPPPPTTPRAPCYHYLQGPENKALGWCSAVTYEHYYYISDVQCQEVHSPLCVLM